MERIEKVADKKFPMAIVDPPDQSRSNSQMSVGASTTYQPAQSLSAMMGEHLNQGGGKRTHLLPVLVQVV